MPLNNTLQYSRFTLSDFDRYQIAQIQKEVTGGLAFEHAQLLYEFRFKAARNLYESERSLCEALELRIAHDKAEAAIPRRANDNAGFQAPSGAQAQAQAPPPKLIDASDWQDLPVPRRQWAVQERVPLRNVTLVSGTGGVGKSTLLLQLACAHVTARDWFGTMPIHGGVLFLSAEDDADELHFRTARIAAHLGVSLSDLAGLRFMPLAGEEALLGVPDRSGVMRATPLFNTLREAALDLKLASIVIDTAADTFGGRENDRAQVRQFITLLRGLAIAAHAAVLLASHPSLQGLSSGSGLSGSTAWDASVRARMYLTPMDASDDAPAADADLRELIVKKSNYGPSGERIQMRWQDGLFVPIGTPSTIDQRAAELRADTAFLDLLKLFTEQNQRVGPYKGPNYAPAKFADHPTGSPFGSRKLAAAMQRLLDAKRIRIEEEGPKSRKVTFLAGT
jgi:RecA-family ATPase